MIKGFTYTYTKQSVRDEDGCMGMMAMSITMNQKQLKETLLSLYRNGFTDDDIVVTYTEELLGLLEKGEPGVEVEEEVAKKENPDDILIMVSKQYMEDLEAHVKRNPEPTEDEEDDIFCNF